MGLKVRKRAKIRNRYNQAPHLTQDIKESLKCTVYNFQDQLSLNAGQMYCRMLQREHSAIFSTFIKLPFAFKIFVLSIFE